MRVFGIVIAACAATSAMADCPVNADRVDAYEDTLKAIEAAPNCEKAADVAQSCAWGSSADVGFTLVAREKCEKEMGTLSKGEKKIYGGLIGLCNRKYKDLDGTMYRSMAAFCRLGEAMHFKDLITSGEVDFEESAE